MNAARPWYVRVLHHVIANPAIYDAAQVLGGLDIARAQLRPLLARVSGLLLDVGAGTGNYADLISPSAKYVWFDNDPDKLRGFRSKYPQALAILGDASRLSIRDKSVDFALCVSVSHHLTDEELTAFLRELARICRRSLIFLDAVQQPDSLVNRILWNYDRGSYPRRREALRARIEEHFDIKEERRYRIYHRYMICVAKPKLQALAACDAATNRTGT